MDYKFDITVIIPVYNVENYLRKCIDSLLSQSIKMSRVEILLIDDGSTDSSPEICDLYAAEHSNIRVFHIDNGGVSNARNVGIENAAGKYIMFLDSDDWLNKKALKSLVSFFNRHYDETDLVTYTEMISQNGEIKPVNHFRYNFIDESGIYDLNDPDYMYFVQTHMNICVKNKGKDNVKFDTGMIFHEDQKYILSILADKQKIGFCEDAIYYYFQNADGASGGKCHPYYIFETTMEMWEHFFNVPEVPKYVQAYFLNDFRWKLKSDVLWPYQYKGEEFEKQKNRIISLIRRCDDDLIRDYPWLMPAHLAYITELKHGSNAEVVCSDKSYGVFVDGKEMLSFDSIELYVSRFHVSHGKLTFVAVIKCLAGNFTDDISAKVKYVYKDGICETLPLALKYSSLSICASRTETNRFRMFILRRSIENLKSLEFSVSIKDKEYPVHLSYPATCPFNRSLKRLSYICDGINIKTGENRITFSKADIFNKSRQLFRSIRLSGKIGYRNALTRVYAPYYKKKHKIWMYCDSSKTVKDNAYYQFIHDCGKQDGIERYYVYNPQADISGWFDDSHKKHLVAYGSLKHRILCLSADKMLTSFYGIKDMLSYPPGAMKYFADIFNFDVIYLQHGVLHAHLPTMYSLDRMMLDREVISTQFEADSLKNNYCFDDSALIKSGMPRYNRIDRNRKPEKKILFAPSWRKFLVLTDKTGNWIPHEKAFLNSEFYKVISEFLSNERLINALKEYGYVLDFKPHPNFRMYDEYFKTDGTYVRLAEKTVDEFSYGIFMTDFSSFVFDFVFLKRPIIYFVPDLDLFEAGLNHYRKLDIPFEEGFGEFAATADKAIDAIIELMKNDCRPDPKYLSRMNGMFFDVDDHCEALYKELTEKN